MHSGAKQKQPCSAVFRRCYTYLICVHNVPYALLHIRYIFKKQIRRLPGFSQSGQLKEQSASRISESFSGSCNAESLARKSAAEQPEFWHCFWVCFSCIFYEPLSLRVKQGVVTAVGVFVDFAVPYACKALGTSQSLTKTADAGEHIYKSNHRFDNEKRGSLCWLPLLVKYVIFSIVHLPPFRCHLVRRSRHQRFSPQLARS